MRLKLFGILGALLVLTACESTPWDAASSSGMGGTQAHIHGRSRTLMGEDFWSYGVEPNRPTWEAIGRFVHEQGLAPRVVTPAEMFPVAVE